MTNGRKVGAWAAIRMQMAWKQDQFLTTQQCFIRALEVAAASCTRADCGCTVGRNLPRKHFIGVGGGTVTWPQLVFETRVQSAA